VKERESQVIGVDSDTGIIARTPSAEEFKGIVAGIFEAKDKRDQQLAEMYVIVQTGDEALTSSSSAHITEDTV
jgi:hypothetical protein